MTLAIIRSHLPAIFSWIPKSYPWRIVILKISVSNNNLFNKMVRWGTLDTSCKAKCIPSLLRPFSQCSCVQLETSWACDRQQKTYQSHHIYLMAKSLTAEKLGNFFFFSIWCVFLEHCNSAFLLQNCWDQVDSLELSGCSLTRATGFTLKKDSSKSFFKHNCLKKLENANVSSFCEWYTTKLVTLTAMASSFAAFISKRGEKTSTKHYSENWQY